MPTQRTFKRRVRARMIKTGESYTAARSQLLAKSGSPAPGPADGPRDPADGPRDTGTDDGGATERSTSVEAIVAATGRPHEEWFAILDAWGATAHGHTEIARWLREAHEVGSWWSQSITVDYERARGMRAQHQMRSGFAISVTRTIAADADALLAAFTEARRRATWLPGVAMRQRPTRAARSARFDWSEPPSRVVVTVDRKDDRRSVVNVAHEQLPDAESADRLKQYWRTWLDRLKGSFEPA